MGLDVVELLMTVEDEFDVEIPVEAAEKMRTVGDLRDFLVQEVQRRASLPQRRGWCRTQQAFYLIRRAVERGHGLVSHRQRIRPSDRVSLGLTPLHWVGVRRFLLAQAAGVDLPDARRGFLRWPVGHTDETITFGDLARRIAAVTEPVWGCRPPLGPEWASIARDPAAIGERLRQIIQNEFGIPLDRIRYHSRIYEDLGLG